LFFSKTHFFLKKGTETWNPTPCRPNPAPLHVSQQQAERKAEEAEAQGRATKVKLDEMQRAANVTQVFFRSQGNRFVPQTKLVSFRIVC
jgi:hypothetical protein